MSFRSKPWMEVICQEREPTHQKYTRYEVQRTTRWQQKTSASASRKTDSKPFDINRRLYHIIIIVRMSKSRRIHIKSIVTNSSINSEPSSKATMNSHYAIGTGGGAVKRIRTPLKHDVLCGRGGGINSHVGNQTFRDFVKDRKNDYNLAQNKAEKARVAREVVDLVKAQNPPGRFLERESDNASSSGWWIECSMAKALSKTSQALREGAPSIRAAHQKDVVPEEAASTKPAGSSTRKTRISTLVPAEAMASPSAPFHVETQNPNGMFHNAALPQLILDAPKVNEDSASADPAEHFVSLLAPLVPHQEHEVTHERPMKRRRLGEKVFFGSMQTVPETTANLSSHVVAPLMSNRKFEHLYGRATNAAIVEHTPGFDVNAPTPPPEVTPPLMPVQAPELPVALSSLPPPMENFQTPMPRRPSEVRLQRSHSLALSDVSSDFAYNEFVNPFEDESFIDHMWGQTEGMQRQTSTSSSTMGRKKLISQASFTQLSDLGESAFTKYQESDFSEGMKMVHDAVHPGVSSPSDEESIPTHLIPYRGMTSRLSTVPSRSPLQYAGSQ